MKIFKAKDGSGDTPSPGRNGERDFHGEKRSNETHATGTAEREAAISMVEDVRGRHRITVGADKAYDTKDFVAEMRDLGAAPHVAQNAANRRSAIDGRTTGILDIR